MAPGSTSYPIQHHLVLPCPTLSTAYAVTMTESTTFGFHDHKIDDCPWYSGPGFLFDAIDNSVDKLSAMNALLQAQWIDFNYTIKARVLVNLCVLFDTLSHFSVAKNHPDFCR